jgi:hypothetical protein
MEQAIIILISIVSTLWLVMLWSEGKKIKEPYFHRTTEHRFSHTMGLADIGAVSIPFGPDSKSYNEILNKMASNIEEETFKKMPTNIHVEGQGYLNSPACPDFKPKDKQ